MKRTVSTTIAMLVIAFSATTVALAAPPASTPAPAKATQTNFTQMTTAEKVCAGQRGGFYYELSPEQRMLREQRNKAQCAQAGLQYVPPQKV